MLSRALSALRGWVGSGGGVSKKFWFKTWGSVVNAHFFVQAKKVMVAHTGVL